MRREMGDRRQDGGLAEAVQSAQGLPVPGFAFRTCNSGSLHRRTLDHSSSRVQVIRSFSSGQPWSRAGR